MSLFLHFIPLTIPFFSCSEMFALFFILLFFFYQVLILICLFSLAFLSFKTQNFGHGAIISVHRKIIGIINVTINNIIAVKIRLLLLILPLLLSSSPICLLSLLLIIIIIIIDTDIIIIALIVLIIDYNL